MTEKFQRGQGAESRNGFLTVSSAVHPNDEATRARSPSISHSLRSNRSSHTLVEGNIFSAEPKRSLPRHETYRIAAKLSFLDRLKGLVRPDILVNRIADCIEAVSSGSPDEEMFDHTDSPFIKTITVSHKDNSSQLITARCMLDTGCLQGNIVSKTFVHELGFEDSDFRPLSSLEKKGGKSVTGDVMIPDGAVTLSWSHGSSAIYRNMRFLVAPHAEFDIIIGALSITKHKIITPPNLGQVPDTGIIHVEKPDELEVDRNLTLADYETPCENLEAEIVKEERKKPRDRKKLRELRKKLAEAQYKRDLKALELKKETQTNARKTLEAEKTQEDIESLKEKYRKERQEKDKGSSDKRKSSKKSGTPESEVSQA